MVFDCLDYTVNGTNCDNKHWRPAVLWAICSIRPAKCTDVEPFCILTAIKSQYSGKKVQILLSLNTNIGSIYQTNPGMHVWATNDKSVQMPRWAVCHTRRREQSWGASPTSGHAKVTDETHMHTHTLLPFLVTTMCVFSIQLQRAAVWEVMNEPPLLLC